MMGSLQSVYSTGTEVLPNQKVAMSNHEDFISKRWVSPPLGDSD